MLFMSNYTKHDLERDWAFAEELLRRMGLGNFSITYKPNTIQWTFWNSVLSPFVIKESFDVLQKFNKKMIIDYEIDIEHQFKEKLPIIKEINDWLYIDKTMTIKNYVEIFSGFCGSSYTISQFEDWLKKNEDLIKC